MGYKVFGITPGIGKRKDPIRFTTKGRVRAYVQYQQDVPKGMERINQWPVELFDSLAPPRAQSAKPEKSLIKQAGSLGRDVMESSPLWYQGRLLLFHSHRVDTPRPDLNAMYLFLKDPATGRELCRFGPRHSLGSALVVGQRIHVFAAEHSGNDWFHDIFHFWSDDLVHWKREPAIARSGGEHLLNSSVCRDDQGYLMAYESNKPVAFCFKFARSKDLVSWEKIPGLAFARNRQGIQRVSGDPLHQTLLLCDLSACRDPRPQWLGVVPGPVKGPRHLGAEPQEPDPRGWRR